MDLDGSVGIKLFAYRWIPDHEGLKGWGRAKSWCQPEDLRLIPWDVVQVGRLHLDPGYCRRLPGGCFYHVREHVEFFRHRCQGLFSRVLLRWIFRDKAGYIPFDSWSRGLAVGKVGTPMRRSGDDSVARGAVGSTSP